MGHNVSLYLEDVAVWDKFKKACDIEGCRPNTVLRNFIETFTREILDENEPIEQRLARSMVEAKHIARGEIKARKADELLDEI